MAHGSIRKRVGTHGDITYQITIENGSDPVTGKRIRIYKSVNGTKRKAEQIMRNMLNALDEDLVLAPSTEKLQDWKPHGTAMRIRSGPDFCRIWEIYRSEN